jgi:pimeloyl-ACP methyl ester carboxylesterase
VSDPLEPRPFSVAGDGIALAGEELGEGPPVVLAHGLTATRNQVVHGSRALPRAGHRVALYDARGHGSSDPAPEGEGYTYDHLADDLETVVADRFGDAPVLAAGHSMGAHTIANLALRAPERFAGLVIVGPASVGVPPTEEILAEWDELADGMARGGVDGFMEVYERRDHHPEFHRAIMAFTRRRLSEHRHPEAVAVALREVPREVPFDGLAELEHLDVPALIVASRDDADPGHPFEVAEAWTQALPRARLISENEGEPPLAWKGGKLSRAIAAFAAEPAVAERLSA